MNEAFASIGIASLIAAERRRQVEVENFTAEHDDHHTNGQLADAAACYLLEASGRHTDVHPPAIWPWAARWWKPGTPERNLVKAGALIVAEIERLDRLNRKQEKSGG